MEITERFDIERPNRVPWLGTAATSVFVVLTGIGVVAGLWKVLVVGWVAFAAMAGAAAFSRFTTSSGDRVVWGDGLASGAMVTSAAVFLIPQAVGYAPTVGGFGIAAGLLAGYAGHLFGHRFSHLDLPLETTTAQLTAHALAAGVVIGTVYTLLPDLGLLLGLAIVSHKGPAGYAAARRLRRQNRPVGTLLVPAAGVGIAATAVGLLDPQPSMAFDAAVFGFAAGIFLHIAMDFLPEYGTDDPKPRSADGHAADRLRIHGFVSTLAGGVVVFLAWTALA